MFVINTCQLKNDVCEQNFSTYGIFASFSEAIMSLPFLINHFKISNQEIYDISDTKKELIDLNNHQNNILFQISMINIINKPTCSDESYIVNNYDKYNNNFFSYGFCNDITNLPIKRNKKLFQYKTRIIKMNDILNEEIKNLLFLDDEYINNSFDKLEKKVEEISNRQNNNENDIDMDEYDIQDNDIINSDEDTFDALLKELEKIKKNKDKGLDLF